MQKSNFFNQADRTAEKLPRNVASSSRTSTAKRPTSREVYQPSDLHKENAGGYSKITNPRKNPQSGYSARAHNRKPTSQNRFPESNNNDPYQEILSYFDDTPERPKSQSRSSKSPIRKTPKRNDMQNMPHSMNGEEFYAAGGSRHFPSHQDQRHVRERGNYMPAESFHDARAKYTRSRTPSQNSIMGIYVGNVDGAQKNNYMYGPMVEENEVSHRFEEFMQKLKLDKEKFYHQLEVNVQRASGLDHQMNPFVAPSKQEASKKALLNLSIEEIVNRSIHNRSTTPDITVTDRSGEFLRSNRNFSVNETRIRDNTELFTNRAPDNSFHDNEGGYRAEPISNYSTLQHGTEDPNMPKPGFSPFTSTIKPESLRPKETLKESGMASMSSDVEIEVHYLKKEISLYENKLKDRDRQIADLKEKLRELTDKIQSTQSDSFKFKFEVERLGSEKKQLEQALQDARNLSSKLQKSLDEYEIQLARFKAQSDVGSRNNVEKEENLRRQIDVLNQELKLLRENNEMLKRSLSEAQSTSSVSKQLNESTEQRMKQYIDREADLKKQIELMKQTIDGKIKEINLLKQVPKDSGAAQQELQKLKSEFSNLSTENEKSKGTIKSLNDQIASLNLQLKTAQDKVKTSETQTAEQINALNSKLNEAQTRIKLYESQSTEGTAALNAKLAEAQEKLKRAESQSNEQISLLNKQLSEAQSKIKLLEAQPNDQLAILNSKLNEYQAKIKQLESQPNQSSIMTMKFEEAQSRIKDLEAKLKEAQSQAQKAPAFKFDQTPVGDEATLRFENQRLEKEMSMIIAKFEAMQKELKEAQEKAERSQSQEEMQQQIEDQERQIIEMSTTIMTLQSEKMESDKRYNDILNNPQKVSEKEKAARNEADKFKTENKKLGSTIQDLEKKLNNLQKDLEKKIAQEQKTNQDLKNQITKITAKDKGAAAAEEHRLMAEKLTRELNALKEQYARETEGSQQKMSTLMAENEKMKNELEAKTKKLNSLSGNEEATQALVARTKEVLALKAEIQKLKSQGGGGGNQQADNGEAAEELERFKKLSEDQKALLKKFQTENKNISAQLSSKEDENDDLVQKLAEKETVLEKLQNDLAMYVMQIGELQMREQEYIAKLKKK